MIGASVGASVAGVSVGASVAGGGSVAGAGTTGSGKCNTSVSCHIFWDVNG